MRFSVEAWAPEYGAPLDGGALDESSAPIDTNVEVPAADWAPRPQSPAPERDPLVLFVDGVQRIDARVWITAANGRAQLGICSTYAAGVARCDGRATIVECAVERKLFTAAEDVAPIDTTHGTFTPHIAAGDTVEHLRRSVQMQMGSLERAVADRAGEGDLLVVDGPLRAPRAMPNAVGYVKTHHVGYLPPVAEDVIARLGPGERTPLFLLTTSWSLYSWYLRLPGGAGHPWAGIVRCETDADAGRATASRLADLTTAVLPRFASRAHKDPRAPQNLYPIAGLERELRRRSGDPALLYRGLARAAARSA